MKTIINSNRILAVALLAMTATLSANARSWRINNDVTKKAQFVDINAAMASEDVQPGDTLYLDPGCNLSSEQNVTKQVTIVGPGYFLSNFSYGTATISGQINLKAAYTTIEGVQMSNQIVIMAQYVTLDRCYVTGYIRSSGNNCQYATIRRCYLPTSVGSIEGQGEKSVNSAYWTIDNCHIYYNDYYYTICRLYSATLRNSHIINNGNYCTLGYMDNATIVNNVIMNLYYSNVNFNWVTNSTISYNILSCDSASYASEAPNNYRLNSRDQSKVFALSGVNDNRYRLAEDSPAKGFALDGGDCGIFGGLYPYVPSGLPQGAPYYPKASISARPVDGSVNVSLNIQLQDE